MEYEEIIRQKKMRLIRSQIIGMAVLKAAKDHDVHIHYLNENPSNMPPAGQPMMPQEKFTMSRDEFKAFILKKTLEEQS